MNFTIMDNGKNIELKDKGNDIPLTSENKDEYISLVIDYYTFNRAANQTFAFINAFMAVIPHECLSVFTIDEFEKVLFGQKEIDIDDWKKNTFYKGKYAGNETHHAVKWFWEVLSDLNNEQK